MPTGALPVISHLAPPLQSGFRAGLSTETVPTACDVKKY